MSSKPDVFRVIEPASLEVQQLWQIPIPPVYVVWDFSTLLLYIFKIRTFRKYRDANPAIHKRIMSILHRMFIVTVFYQVLCTMNGVGMAVLDEVLGSAGDADALLTAQVLCFSVIYSYSMFIMCEHNGKQYARFLRAGRFVFCCCRGIVREQLAQFEVDTCTLDAMDGPPPMKKGKSDPDPTMDTRTHHGQLQAVHSNDFEVSFETCTVVET